MRDRSLTAQIRARQKAVSAGEPGIDLEALRADLESRRGLRR